MFPTLAVNDAPDYLPDDAVALRNVGLWHSVSVQGANLTNLIFRQPRQLVLRTMWRVLPALSGHIAHVVGMGAQKQMGWIAASGNVTGMQDMHPGGDGSDKKLIREAVSLEVTTLGSEVAVTITASVRMGGNGAGPQPATIRPRHAIQFSEESITQWYHGRVNLLERLAVPRLFIAARGFCVPNYTTALQKAG